MQRGVSRCVMDISGQSSGTDHIRTRSAEVCQLLKRPLEDQSNCVCSTLVYLFSVPPRYCKESSITCLNFSLKSLLCKNEQLSCVQSMKQFSPIWAQRSLSSSFRGEGKVASYVTKRHFDAVRRLMYEGWNGQCWNSRPHTHTQMHTNTRLMDDTSIWSRIGAHCSGADEQF